MKMQATVSKSEFDQRVSEFLFYVWDPIGVNRMPACRDEYEDYVPIISAYLLDNAPESDVDALMMFIMEEYIGVQMQKSPHRKAQHLETIRMLMEWKGDFLSKYPEANSPAPKFPKDGSYLDQMNWSRDCVLRLKNQH